jgi:hypothetical protein
LYHRKASSPPLRPVLPLCRRLMASAADLYDCAVCAETAFSAAVVAGAWTSAFGSIASVQQSEACTINPTLFPFPKATPGGVLAKVLSSGVWQVGYNADSNFLSDEGVPLINTFTNPPTGAHVAFMNAIVTAMSTHYGVPVRANWTYFAGSVASFRVRSSVPLQYCTTAAVPPSESL